MIAFGDDDHDVAALGAADTCVGVGR